MRANADSTMLTALTRPAAKAAAISPAVVQAKSNAFFSSTEHRGRLGLVGERETVDESRMLKQQLQIKGDGRMPSRLDRQRKRLDARGGKRLYVIGLSARNGRAGGLACRADFALRLRGLRVMPTDFPNRRVATPR